MPVLRVVAPHDGERKEMHQRNRRHEKDEGVQTLSAPRVLGFFVIDRSHVTSLFQVEVFRNETRSRRTRGYDGENER